MHFKISPLTLFIVVSIFSFSCGKDKKRKEEPLPEESTPADANPEDQTQGPLHNLEEPKKQVKAKSSPTGGAPSALVIGTPGESKVATLHYVELERKRLLIPEQFSQFLESTFGYAKKVKGNAWWGFHRDWILAWYQTKLGGADFRNVFSRRSSISPQILLNIRDAAYWYIADFIWDDRNRQEDGVTPLLFLHANPVIDRPFMEKDQKLSSKNQSEAHEREEKWRLQWLHNFSRLLQRAPTPLEMEIIRDHFLKVISTENNNSATWSAWIMTMTHFLMIEEVWNS